MNHYHRVPDSEGNFGKYDDLCQKLFESLNCPDAVCLLVLNGPHGHGFSLTTKSLAITAALPALLRTVADGIEQQHRQAQKQ